MTAETEREAFELWAKSEHLNGVSKWTSEKLWQAWQARAALDQHKQPENSAMSEFIRNATNEEKGLVYRKVLDKSTKRQSDMLPHRSTNHENDTNT